MTIHNLRRVARWESVGGRYWVEVFFDPAFQLADGRRVPYAQYQGDNCGGSFAANDAERAVLIIQERVERGEFQADRNKTPMRRVL